MQKLLFTGVHKDISEAGITSALETVGPVDHVLIVRDGNPLLPWVVVSMDISWWTALAVVARPQRYWPGVSAVRARVLPPQFV